MSNTMLITSGKGGVGKSTFCSMLAIELSCLDKKILVFDYDTGLRNVDIILDMQNDIVYNVIDYIDSNVPIESIVLQSKKYPNLYMISTSQYAKQKDISQKDLSKLLNKLRDNYDYILIDCPAGLEKYVKNALKVVDQTIIVTTGDNVALRDAEKVVFEINKYGLERPYIVVNKQNKKLVKKGLIYDSHEVAAIIDATLLGYIDDDISVFSSINNGGLPNRNCEAFKCVHRIAKRLLGEDIEIKKLKNKKKFWSIFG